MRLLHKYRRRSLRGFLLRESIEKLASFRNLKIERFVSVNEFIQRYKHLRVDNKSVDATQNKVSSSPRKFWKHRWCKDPKENECTECCLYPYSPRRSRHLLPFYLGSLTWLGETMKRKSSWKLLFFLRARTLIPAQVCDVSVTLRQQRWRIFLTFSVSRVTFLSSREDFVCIATLFFLAPCSVSIPSYSRAKAVCDVVFANVLLIILVCF